jgi:riboflavin synthase
MFTGIIKDLGRIVDVETGADGQRLSVGTDWETDSFELGESIAVDGVCLTVTDVDDGRFDVDVSPETLDRTTLGELGAGDEVHLERALRVGDRLGGHFVQGHIDGVGTLVSRERDGDAWRLDFEAPEGVARWLVSKGSIAIDGVSLTVNAVDECRFSVAIIPHTADKTKLASYQPGDRVNLEADMLGKYVGRLMARGRELDDAPFPDFQNDE